MSAISRGHTDPVPDAASALLRPARRTSRQVSLLLSAGRTAVGITVIALADRLTSGTRYQARASALVRAFGACDLAVGAVALTAVGANRAGASWTRAGALLDLADRAVLAVAAGREQPGAIFACGAVIAGWVGLGRLSRSSRTRALSPL